MDCKIYKWYKVIIIICDIYIHIYKIKAETMNSENMSIYQGLFANEGLYIMSNM